MLEACAYHFLRVKNNNFFFPECVYLSRNKVYALTANYGPKKSETMKNKSNTFLRDLYQPKNP